MNSVAASPFNDMLALLGMLPADVRASMVAMYSDSLSGQMDELCHALEEGDVHAMQGLAHKVAGAAAMMQDKALSTAARDMEGALRECRAADAVQAWPRIRHCATATLEELRLMRA